MGWNCKEVGDNSTEWPGTETKCVKIQRNVLQCVAKQRKGLALAGRHVNSKEWPGTARKSVEFQRNGLALQGSLWKLKTMAWQQCFRIQRKGMVLQGSGWKFKEIALPGSAWDLKGMAWHRKAVCVVHANWKTWPITARQWNSKEWRQCIKIQSNVGTVRQCVAIKSNVLELQGSAWKYKLWSGTARKCMKIKRKGLVLQGNVEVKSNGLEGFQGMENQSNGLEQAGQWVEIQGDGLELQGHVWQFKEMSWYWKELSYISKEWYGTVRQCMEIQRNGMALQALHGNLKNLPFKESNCKQNQTKKKEEEEEEHQENDHNEMKKRTNHTTSLNRKYMRSYLNEKVFLKGNEAGKRRHTLLRSEHYVVKDLFVDSSSSREQGSLSAVHTSRGDDRLESVRRGQSIRDLLVLSYLLVVSTRKLENKGAAAASTRDNLKGARLSVSRKREWPGTERQCVAMKRNHLELQGRSVWKLKAMGWKCVAIHSNDLAWKTKAMAWNRQVWVEIQGDGLELQGSVWKFKGMSWYWKEVSYISKEWYGTVRKCMEIQRNEMELQISMCKFKGMNWHCQAVHGNLKDLPFKESKCVTIKRNGLVPTISRWQIKGMAWNCKACMKIQIIQRNGLALPGSALKFKGMAWSRQAVSKFHEAGQYIEEKRKIQQALGEIKIYQNQPRKKVGFLMIRSDEVADIIFNLHFFSFPGSFFNLSCLFIVGQRFLSILSSCAVEQIFSPPSDVYPSGVVSQSSTEPHIFKKSHTHHPPPPVNWRPWIHHANWPSPMTTQTLNIPGSAVPPYNFQIIALLLTPVSEPSIEQTAPPDTILGKIFLKFFCSISNRKNSIASHWATLCCCKLAHFSVSFTQKTGPVLPCQGFWEGWYVLEEPSYPFVLASAYYGFWILAYLFFSVGIVTAPKEGFFLSFSISFFSFLLHLRPSTQAPFPRCISSCPHQKYNLTYCCPKSLSILFSTFFGNYNLNPQSLNLSHLPSLRFGRTIQILMSETKGTTHIRLTSVNTSLRSIPCAVPSPPLCSQLLPRSAATSLPSLLLPLMQQLSPRTPCCHLTAPNRYRRHLKVISTSLHRLIAPNRSTPHNFHCHHLIINNTTHHHFNNINQSTLLDPLISQQHQSNNSASSSVHLYRIQEGC
ncbi:hypothetical protein VP01_515g5 [Puccinia sorghi]|uniref:Uncharacterized protein n=1 Tax=Puccinia sorghi TaxID=27349 RepID=A0A0L6UKY5_9BASI|nr:hypothetical protein VP01_515g5 [Puccinia sorghi]